MPQFRRKPIVVSASQFVRADVLARTHGRSMDLETGASLFNGQWSVMTRDGLAGVADGDWIVTYTDGQQEVWRPSTFAAMWEEVQ